MPRNTAVLLVFLTIFAAIVVGVNLFKEKGDASTESVANVTPTPIQHTVLLTYRNDVCGISFQYPSGVNKLESGNGAVFSDPDATDSGVMVTCQKEIPRVPLPAARIETIQIGTVSATLYHDASPKDDSPIDKLIFTHPGNNLDIYIAGFGPVFRQLTASIKLL